MVGFVVRLLTLICLAPRAAPYVLKPLSGAPSSEKMVNSRRSFARSIATAPLLAPFLESFRPVPSYAAASLDDPESLVDVYFGMGCFWHIQHEFVVAESVILKRKEIDLSSRVGYAGGSKVGKKGGVCYHNLSRVDDYGKNGHCEVRFLRTDVSMLHVLSILGFSVLSSNKHIDRH